MSQKLQVSIETGIHSKLNTLTGKWKGESKTWFGPNELVDESLLTAEIIALFDKRFIRMNYTGTFKEKTIEGEFTFAFAMLNQQFQCTWLDTFHTGSAMMQFANENSNANLIASGSYATGVETEPLWFWRIELSIQNENQFSLLHYNISPQGEECLAIEVLYSRIDK